MYCRVSAYLGTAQKHSLDWQIQFYAKVITEHPDWIFAGIFLDTGKNGLRRNGRNGLDKYYRKQEKGRLFQHNIYKQSIKRTLDIIKRHILQKIVLFYKYYIAIYNS